MKTKYYTYIYKLYVIYTLNKGEELKFKAKSNVYMLFLKINKKVGVLGD